MKTILIALIITLKVCASSPFLESTNNAEKLLFAYNLNETIAMKRADFEDYKIVLQDITTFMRNKGIKGNAKLTKKECLSFGESNLIHMLDLFIEKHNLYFYKSEYATNYIERGKANAMRKGMLLLADSFVGDKHVFRWNYVKPYFSNTAVHTNKAKCLILGQLVRPEYCKIISKDINSFNQCWEISNRLRKQQKTNNKLYLDDLLIGIRHGLFDVYKNHFSAEQLDALLEKCPDDNCDWGIFAALRSRPTLENFNVYKKHIRRFSKESEKEINKDIKEFQVASEKHEKWQKDIIKDKNAKDKEKIYRANLRADVKKIKKMPLTNEKEYTTYINEIKRVHDYTSQYPPGGFHIDDHINRISIEPHTNLKDVYLKTLETAEATNENSFDFELAITCASALTRVAEENDYPRLFSYINTYASTGKRLFVFTKKGAKVKRQAAITILTAGVSLDKSNMYEYFNLHLDEVKDKKVKKAMLEGIKHFGIKR